MSKTQPQQEPSNLVEICRSFSFKINAGNYESRDFFCSEKAECKLEDAEKLSAALYQFCKSEVMRDVRAWCEEHGLPMPGGRR